MSTCDHTKPVFGCDGCIARGSIGDLEEPPTAANLYRVDVTVTKSDYFYILAASKEAAEADAREIHSEDFSILAQVDRDEYVSKVRPEHRVLDGDEVWTGGAKGEWRSAKSLGLAQEGSRTA